MGLDFTHIADKEGAAAYFIHDDSTISQDAMKHLAEQVQQLTTKQVVVVPATSPDGRNILEFYDIESLNVILIVQDDDQLAESYTEQDSPSADQIAYTLNQIG